MEPVGASPETEDDLEALLGEAQAKEPEFVASEEDFDSLLEDLDADEEEDIEDTIVLEPDEDTLVLDTDDDTVVLEPGDIDLESNEEDLDALLEDLDAGSEEDDFPLEEVEDLETGLNVGVEDDVAHILATGQAAPSSREEDFLDEDTDLQSEVATILFVDDAPDNPRIFQDALQDGDYNFLESESLEEAQDILLAQDVNLIFLNLDLASDDPFEFLQQVISDPNLPEIPVIINGTQNDAIEQALRMGAADYFVLPLGVMDLEFQVPQKVSNLLKLRKAERLLASVENRAETIVSFGPSSPPERSAGQKSLEDLFDEAEDQALPEDLLTGAKTAKKPERTAEQREARKRLVPISDQERIRTERKVSRPKTKSRTPLFLTISLLMVAVIAIAALATKYFVQWRQQELATERAPSPPEPLPVLKPPSVPQADYEMSRQRVRRPDTYQRQADMAKTRIRQTVQNLADGGGAWWSPWRVLRESGGSLNRLVNQRRASDILDIFGVDISAVERGLQSQGTLDFLAKVGFDLRGKRATDLSARETFELLSARQIREKDQIVNILSDLQDRLAKDRTAQAKRRARQKKSNKDAADLQTPRRIPVASVASAAVAVAPAYAERQTAAFTGEIRGSPLEYLSELRHPPGAA